MSLKANKLIAFLILTLFMLFATIAIIILLNFKKTVENQVSEVEARLLLRSTTAILRNELLQGNLMSSSQKISSFFDDTNFDNICLVVFDKNAKSLFVDGNSVVCRSDTARELNDFVYYDDVNINKAYSIKIKYKPKYYDFKISNSILIFIIILLIFIGVIFYILFSLSSKIFNAIEGVVSGGSVKTIMTMRILEVETIGEVMQLFRKREIDIEKLKIEGKKNELLSSIASQVSHDIRSPLSALNMALYGLESVPEERRILIRNAVQRINDIANDLLEKSKSSKLGITTIVTSSIEQMSPLIDSLVSEKRIQFRDKSNIEISVHLENSYGLFAKVNANEFKRVLSNVINNSVEAANVGKKTIISVAVFLNNNSVVIQINDNGKGIPQHILSKLGTQEITSGKDEAGSGNGLGVMHAKKTIESFGGDFKIESKSNVGTTIKIFLPLADTPDWFLKKLFLEQGMNFITFDDDISIHQIWSGRLSSLQVNKQNITHFSFSNPKEFKEKVPVLLKQKCILLVDYEIISEKNNGLDFVEQIAEQDKSILKSTILVTSRYDENPIKERCQRLGIKMIPKAMAGYVPIEIVDSKQRFDAILLDDDLLVHECWKMYATENNKVIKLFTNFEEFMSFLPSVDFQTKIYVDSNLGSNSSLKGEDVLRKINALGFQSLYLCTGYESGQFADIQFIKGVVGKEPKF